MNLEDPRRFEVDALAGGEYDGGDHILLTCTRCRWDAEIADMVTLAELNQRAAEHAEVCR